MQIICIKNYLKPCLQMIIIISPLASFFTPALAGRLSPFFISNKKKRKNHIYIH